jgi:hypothetical protein
MTSARPGQSTSAVEVTNVSPHGFWVLVEQREYFARFTDFPWFRDATIAELMKVELSSAHRLYWPDLDVDLAVESLDCPERYPLVSRARATNRLQRTKARRPPQGRRGRRSRLGG